MFDSFNSAKRPPPWAQDFLYVVWSAMLPSQITPKFAMSTVYVLPTFGCYYLWTHNLFITTNEFL